MEIIFKNILKNFSITLCIANNFVINAPALDYLIIIRLKLLEYLP